MSDKFQKRLKTVSQTLPLINLLKNDTRPEAFEEEVHEMRDDLETSEEHCKSTFDTVLTSVDPVQRNNATPLLHSDNASMSIIAFQI